MVTVLAGLLLAGLLMVTQAGDAWACSCVSSSLADRIEPGSVVFAGTAVARDTLGIDDSGEISSTDPIRWTFDVETVYRGPVEVGQQVDSVRADASCGYMFQVGVRYLVVAAEQDGRLWTGSCTGTAAITDIAATDLAALGTGGPPDPASATGDLTVTAAPALESAVAAGPSEPQNSGNVSTDIVLAVGAAVALAAVVLFGVVLRRRVRSADRRPSDR